MSRDAWDPEVREFVETMGKAWKSYPDFMTLSPAEARAVAEKVRAPWRQGGPAMARTMERTIPTSAGPLRLRIHHPHERADAPALIYLHGGGFTLFSIDTHDRLMREYAAAGEFAVIGVDYPLAPEVRYPVALDRIVALVDWIGAHGGEIGVDAARIAIGGDSAGGNLSVAASLRLRDAGRGDRIRAMLLNYGGFAAHISDAAETAFGGPTAVLNRDEAAYYWSNYLGDAAGGGNPYAEPLIADLTGLPPALLVVAEQDIIAEQSSAMAARMAEAGVAARLKVYRGATHSFLEAMSISSLAREAIADGATWVRDQLR